MLFKKLINDFIINIIKVLISNEIHLYEMLITNLLIYFNKVERSHNTTSRKIVSRRTRSRSTRNENNINNNFLIKYHRNINFYSLYERFIYIKNIE